MAPEVIEGIRTFLRIPARVHEVPRIRQLGPAGVPATPIPDPPHEHAPSMTNWRSVSYTHLDVYKRPGARMRESRGEDVVAVIGDHHRQPGAIQVLVEAVIPADLFLSLIHI